MTEREKKLVAILREAQRRLRVDPFVRVNTATYIEQELEAIEREERAPKWKFHFWG
jgi:hypothetical protein